jgi:hypothetical protein
VNDDIFSAKAEGPLRKSKPPKRVKLKNILKVFPMHLLYQKDRCIAVDIKIEKMAPIW